MKRIIAISVVFLAFGLVFSGADAQAWTITISAGAGGSMDPPPTSVDVPDGGSQSFTITPDPGYVVKKC